MKMVHFRLLTSILSVLVATSFVPAAVVTNGLTSLWKFDDTSGPTFDSQNPSRNPTRLDGVTRGVPGVFGNAYQFSPSGTGGITLDSSWFDVRDSNFSIGTWFKSTSAASQVLFYFYGGIKMYGIQLESNGQPYATARTDNGAVTATLTGSTGYNDGKWHYQVYTRNGSLWTLYVDGVQVGQRTQPLGEVSRSGSSGAVTLYARVGGIYTSNANSTNPVNSENLFTGSMDELQLYNRALTLTEVQSNFNASIPEPRTLGVIVPIVALLLRRCRNTCRRLSNR